MKSLPKYFNAITFILFNVIASNAMATTYYVKPDGNDNASGKTHLTAWKSINKVNSYKFQTGDDVYFFAGGSWKLQKLAINWNGTSSNRAIVGAYYMNNGKETIGLPAQNKKPRIIGSYVGKCSGTAGSCIANSKAVPSNAYSGLVVIGANYVTLQDMRIKILQAAASW